MFERAIKALCSGMRREFTVVMERTVMALPNDTPHVELETNMRSVHSDPLKPVEWSIELLRQIEFNRFAELAAAYFREQNFRTKCLLDEADSDAYITLFVKDKAAPFAIVRCNAWNSRKVGVKSVRELLGVMALEKVAKGILVTTGDYTQDAIACAEVNAINLISGEALLKDILALPGGRKRRLLAVALYLSSTTRVHS